MSIGGAVFLIAVGAILRYAVQDSIEGIDLEVVGLILMIAGVLGVILTFAWTRMADRRYGRDPYDRPPDDRYR